MSKPLWLGLIITFWLAGCSQMSENVKEEDTKAVDESAVSTEKSSELPLKENAKTPKESVKPAVQKKPPRAVAQEEPSKIAEPSKLSETAEKINTDKTPVVNNSPTVVSSSTPSVTKVGGRDEMKGDKPAPTFTVIKSETVMTSPTGMAQVPDRDKVFKKAVEYDKNHDLLKAFTWYREAAEQGLVAAQLRLAEMFYFGEGVPQDSETAEKWYRKAAEQGNMVAQYGLGQIYYDVDEFLQAKQWFSKSAAQGYPNAKKKLGMMYYKGQGVPRQLSVAFQWFKQAAEQGVADAQNNLALMYFKGEGITKDFILSYQWVSLAAAQGNQEARRAKEFFTTKITPAQLSEGERLAKEWEMRHQAKLLAN